MAKFQVTFRNGLNSDSETCEFPTDDLMSNGAVIESFSFVKSEIKRGENFARETWEYEVSREDAERFATGLDSTQTILTWKRLKR